MNAYALVPLVAAGAYLPLLVVLFYSKPWQSRQRLFFAFLVAALLWSLTTFLSRSGLLIQDRVLEARIIFVLFVVMLVQFHYLISTFYRSGTIRIPWAYVFVVATVVLTAMGLIPRDTDPLNYGPWVVGIVVGFLVTVGLSDARGLLRSRKVSSKPRERNQIVYLLVAMGALSVFLLINILPVAGEYPVAHAGNLVVAGTLTYAVVAHRLLDMRVVFRQAFINLALYGSSIGVVLVVFWLVHGMMGRDATIGSMALAMCLGIALILLLVQRAGRPWQIRMEWAFVGEKFAYRRKLFQFVTSISDIWAMQEFGEEFIKLLAQSIDCRRAALLVPEQPAGAFIARFRYPPTDDNPMRQLRLRPDNPVVAWLRHKGSVLLARDLAVLPEFQGMRMDERDALRDAGLEILVALVNRGEPAGILAIGARRGGGLYTVEDMDLLESTAMQVAAGLEKEYYHEQMEEQRKEIDLLNRLAKIVTSSISIDSIFEGFVKELREMVSFDWATISLVDGDELHILALASNTDSPWRSDGRMALAGTATEYVCRERKKVYEPNLTAYQRFVTGKHHLEQGVRSILYLPLQIKEKCIGAFIVASRERDAFGPKQIRLLEQVAMQIATPVENSQLYAKAEQRSRIDEMTGLFNRRHFEERIKEEISRHGRDGEDFSILYLDLDNFKTYNDIYGHPTGDILLNQIGKIIKGSIRGADQAFRYGGDEFVVILPGTGMADAHIVAERVRGEIAGRMEEMDVAVTCSIGVSTYPADGVIPGELVTVADTAQYFAKRTGGNRVYLSSKVLSEPLDDVGVSSRHNGLSTIYALASIVEARDPYTYGHSKRVNSYAVALAEKAGLSPDEVSRVSTAAMLHDIGKIGIPDRVLNKKSKVIGEDWEVIKAHCRLGATIVGRIPNLVPCVSIILHHHERWDGGGYPEGLKGEEISMEARILAIADSFEAMTSARPYRAALSSEQAVEELRRCAGSQFDPELVRVFTGIIEAGLPGKADGTEQVTIEKTGR